MAAGPRGRARPARRPGASGCANRARPAIGADVRRKIAILGATGSIGKSTLDLVERSPERFEVVAVTAATNSEALAQIARRVGARLAGVVDETGVGGLPGRAAGDQLPAGGGGGGGGSGGLGGGRG